MTTLFHIARRAAWDAARSRGEYRPPSLEAEGFIHLSTEEQWRHTLHRYYRDEPDLVVLCIDAGRLGSELRYERADDDDFPHLYGPLPIEAVTWVRDVPRILPISPAIEAVLKTADPAVEEVVLCSVADHRRTVTYVVLSAKPGRAGSIALREVMLAAGAMREGVRETLANAGWMQLHAFPRLPDGRLDEPAFLAYVEGLIADD